MERIPLRDNAPGQGLLLTSLAILGLGVVMVHSALSSPVRSPEWWNNTDVRHTVFAVLAAVVLLTAWRIDYGWLNRGKRLPLPAVIILGLALASAVAVLLPGVGHAVGGEKRWLRLAPGVQFQPSELVKIGLLIFLAAWLSRPGTNVKSFWKTFVPACAVIGVSVLLVIKEDFGTGALIGLTGVATLFLAGAPLWQLGLFVPAGAAGWWVFVVNNPSKWARIEAWLNVWNTADWGTYQPRQALLAIISGGWWGKGVGEGALKHGGLPEDTTDFIFSVFAEEWGGVGAMLLIALVAVWVWHMRKAAMRTGDPFGRLLASSLGIMAAGMALMHVAVNLGAIPCTGQGFPLLSAGGTSLMITAFAVAMIVSVSSRPAESPQDQMLERSAAQSPPSPRPVGAT
jgi:cell division protein FtsW